MRRKVIGTPASKTAVPFIEKLESRDLFSALPLSDATPVADVSAAPAALHADNAHVHKTATLIKFTLTPSTVMGQTVFLTARVRNPDGSPVTGGTVDFIQNNSIFATGTVDHRGYCTITLYNAFAGSYSFRCQYEGTRRLLPAVSGNAPLAVHAPTFAFTNDGLGEYTPYTGTGAATVSGSHFVLDYTEYLFNGTYIGSTIGSTPLSGVVGTNLIDGFSEGITGLQVGQVRVLDIAPNIGYGSNPPSPIPKNTNLIFIVKLISFT